MDGTKRKARSPPVPPTTSLPVIDLGTTPPWSVPATIHQESALRSTLQPPNTTIHADALHQPAATRPLDAPSWSPLSSSAKQQLPLQGRKRIGMPRPDAIGSPILDPEEDVDVHVDTNNDGVYMMNAKEGSWSGSLPSEDDPEVQQTLPFQAELALKHLKQAKELVKQHERLKAANIAMEVLLEEKNSTDMTPEDEAKWQKDLLLRNTVRQITKELQQGAMLTLERLGPVNLTMKCAHPLCPAPDKLIPAGAYYIILAQPCRIEGISRYCLFCVEELWDGKGIVGQLPDPCVQLEHVEVQQKISRFDLDGAMDDNRLSAAGVETMPLMRTPDSSIFTTTNTSSPAALDSVCTPPTDYSSGSALIEASKDTLKSKTFEPMYDSPLLRKSQLPQSASEKEDEAALKLEGSFRERINKASAKLQNTQTLRGPQPVRRSSRLKSTSAPASLTPTTQTSGPRPKSKELTPTAAKTVRTDSIADEIRRADMRLKVMYDEREKALQLLKPGERVMINHPNCTNSKLKRFLSMDMFGIVYTDLLADHAKYWTKQAVLQTYNSSKIASDADVSVSPKPPRFPKWQKSLNAEESWCVCYGLEDGRDMIECESENCLVGWYHLECVGADVAVDDGWLCPICASQQAGDIVLQPTIDPELVKGLFDPPFAHLPVYDIGRSTVIRHDDYTAFEDDSRSYSFLHLDGASDPPSLSYQPSKPSPLSQTHFQIPESLLSSKHAPTADELSSYLSEQTNPKMPTPTPVSLPETPGSPQSSEESMTSSGNWRHPPTRFQYLAKFFRPGNSLNETEKAAVELWKAASEEQLQWNGFREKYEQSVHELTDLSESHTEEIDVLGDASETNATQLRRDDGSLEEGEVAEPTIQRRGVGGSLRKGYVEEHSEELTRGLESDTGLTKSQCHGKKLTGILASIRSQGLQPVDQA